MAELLLCVTDEVRPDTAYQDGDIVCAFNDRRILCCHAEMHCHPRRAPRNGSGLILPGSLAQRWYERTAQYRFERVSATEVRRTVIATGQVEVIGPRPNARGERMDVRLYLRRRRARADHRIFGEDGAEVWYGGTTDVSMPVVAAVWDEIEEHSPHRRAEHRLWPLGGVERRHFLPLSMAADVDDATAQAMESPEVDETDPDNPVTLRKRTQAVPWRDVLPSAYIEAALDRAREFDARGLTDRGQPVRAVRSQSWRKPTRGRV